MPGPEPVDEATPQTGGAQDLLRRIVEPEQFLDRLKQVLLDGSAPLIIADLQGQVLYANDAYRRIAPALYDSGQAIGLDRGGDARQAAPELASDFVETVAALGEPMHQEIVISIDGRTRHFHAEHATLRDRDGNQLAIIGRYTAVDELKSARTALDLAEERFDDVTRLVSDWVWETGRDLCLSYISPRVTEALGRHPRELIGEKLSRLVFSPTAASKIEAVLDARGPFRGIEAEFETSAGEHRVFQLSGLPVYGRGQGEFTGYRGVAQDVTELAVREAALNQAVDAAETANRAKSEFLANMSHELRTPLNAIIGFSEIMKTERFGPIGSDRYKAYLDDVFESAHHLLTLINDVLDVAKIEAGQLELHESQVEPTRLIDSVVRLVAERAERARVNLTKSLGAGLPVIVADERKLKQILLNLLSNAIKFTPENGRVEISASYDAAGEFRMAVADTGIGMKDEDLAIALAPFGQVDGQLSRRFEGTGLGLPLSKALAELHGGSLDFETEPGHGTTVTLRLPHTRLLLGDRTGGAT